MKRSSPTNDDGSQRSWSPVAVLIAAAGATAVFTALLTSVGFVLTTGAARPREMPLFWLLRYVCDAAGWKLLSVAPLIVNSPFDLESLRGAVQFAAIAVGTNLLLSWLGAAALLPAVVLLERLADRSDRRWTRDFPAAAFALFALPNLVGLTNAWLRTPRVALTISVSVAGAVILCLVLRGVCASPRRVRRLLGGSAWAAGAATLLVFVPAAATSRAPAPGVSPRPPAPAAAPNILLVSIDSLRSDHLHCYGYAPETSPTIDGLARAGVLFRTVVSPTSWTLPAHLTLLTALPPEVHGVVVDGMRLGDGSPMLAEVLRDAGWVTAGFVSGAYLDAIYGFSRGFDSYDDYSLVQSSPRFSRRTVTSPALDEEVTAWLRRWAESGRERPFFLFVHMFDVHYDYQPPPPYDRFFDPDYSGPLREDQFRHSSGIPDKMSPRDLQHLIALYDGEIRFTDHHLGRILDRLGELGVLDDTIVVVTSDHGDEFYEHGQVGHRQSLYDELVLVPLVVRYPRRVPAGRVVEGQVRLMDVGPTLLALAGIAAPSFGATNLGHGEAARDLTSLFERGSQPPALVAFGDLEGKLSSVRTPEFKYLRGKPGPGEEFYDLKTDPGEMRNRIDEKPSTALALGHRLAEWRSETDAARTGQRARAVAVDGEHRAQLRALGYVQ